MNATPTLTPTAVANAFWAMSNRFKELIETGALGPGTPGVQSWQVAMLPAHEIVTFETTSDGLISAAWTTINPQTREEDFSQITLRPSTFDLIFARDVRVAIPA